MKGKKLGKIITAKVEGTYCDACEEAFPLTELTTQRDGELCCEECYIETCGFCGETIEKDGYYCSYECGKADNTERV